MSEIPFDAPCPCGSGKHYVRCCGTLDRRIFHHNAHGRISGKLTDPQFSHVVANEPRCMYQGTALPPGFLVRELGDEYDWQTLARSLTVASDAEDARVVTDGGGQKSAWRLTDIVEQGEYAEAVVDLVRRIYRDLAEPFYRCKMRSLESPHILRYREGFYYRPHADADQLNPDTGRWEKKLDRDLSLLVYLDDDYDGGEITFPNFDFILRPRPGHMVMFPSDFRYLHGVMPVTRGVRHAIVSWGATESGQRQ